MNGSNQMDGNGTGTAETTGRYLVLLREDAVEAGISALSSGAQVRVTRSSGLTGMTADALPKGEAIIFDKIGVAVVDAPPQDGGALKALVAQNSAILAVEPERYVYPFYEQIAPSKLPVEYLLGYQESMNTLVNRMLSLNGAATIGELWRQSAGAAVIDETRLTWGLQVTRVAQSRFTGKGVRIAILDTGIDLTHPDFAGRAIINRSFITGEGVQDGHGHGTHVAGTACGPLNPGVLPRYGIAYESELFVGKVLSNAGRGSDTSVLAGIEWAIQNKCDIVSMSLGSPISPGQSFSPIYEAVAKRALAQDTLIIAAAGNESTRPNHINPVGRPANSPSILAVGALDAMLQVAQFSNGGVNASGGQIDIVAPGVNVYSSVPQPKLYDRFRGTSMATPHVAGIAALLAEANPGMRGGTLGWLLLQSARRLDLPAGDVGAGLVQAP